MSAEIVMTEEALAGAAREAERFRRAARERSHVTLLGQSVVRDLPPRPSVDDGGSLDGHDSHIHNSGHNKERE
jgi:hypothetical protein